MMDFKCTNCGARFNENEADHTVDNYVICPKCYGENVKAISASKTAGKAADALYTQLMMGDFIGGNKA